MQALQKQPSTHTLFRMKCHLCDNHFEMQTDPANFEYVIISGLKRKEQRWNPDENEQIAPDEKKKHRKLESDPMFKLEHGKQDQEKVSARDRCQDRKLACCRSCQIVSA